MKYTKNIEEITKRYYMFMLSLGANKQYLTLHLYDMQAVKMNIQKQKKRRNAK